MTRFADCRVAEDIVGRARLGDPSANEVLYRTYATAVFNLALRLTRQRTLAEEILQETFIEVLTKIGTFRGECQPGTWIREITVNKCLMQLRSGWHRKSQPLETWGQDAGNGFTTEPGMEHLDLERSLDALPPVSRTVLWLHDVEGYTHREIGRLMGKSSSFSKSQLARAHKRLRERLDANSECDQPCMQLSNNY